MRFRRPELIGLRSRAAAAAEFAILLPFLALLLLGTLEVSRLTSVSELLTNIARDGARVAVINGKTNADVTTRVTTMLSNASINGYTVTITPQTAADVQSSALGEPITVTISVPYGNVSWSPAPYFLKGSTIVSGTAVLSSEHNPPF
jgi:Flp pilus assembly protein TadG